MAKKYINGILSIIWMKIRHPFVKTSGWHYVRPGTEIIMRNGGVLSIGGKVATQYRVTFSVIGGNLSIDNNTSFNRNNILVCREKIQIGSRCSFGPNVVVYDHDHAFNSEQVSGNHFKTSEIVIEDNCWIGANVTILRGTHIGKGSVIGAGSVVKGNIPPHSLVKMSRELNIEKIKDRSRLV